VSDRTPRVTLAVLLRRMVLLIVTQWFMLGARERDMRFSAGSGCLERRNTLLPWVDLYVVCYKRRLLNGEKLMKICRWEYLLMGFPLGLIYTIVGQSLCT
jgi:hypothetical protein